MLTQALQPLLGKKAERKERKKNHSTDPKNRPNSVATTVCSNKAVLTSGPSYDEITDFSNSDRGVSIYVFIKFT